MRAPPSLYVSPLTFGYPARQNERTMSESEDPVLSEHDEEELSAWLQSARPPAGASEEEARLFRKAWMARELPEIAAALDGAHEALDRLESRFDRLDEHCDRLEARLSNGMDSDSTKEL